MSNEKQLSEKGAGVCKVCGREPRAAPPISQEQAQPDAQDLTEEEIANLDADILRAKFGQVSRLLAEVKRRRGIK